MASGQAGQDAEPKKTLAEIESERITRRAALRKFGFGAGMAALMALSVDDLARMAAVKLQQNAGDNQVANAVAKEFRNAGMAFAFPETEDSCSADDGCAPNRPVVPAPCTGNETVGNRAPCCTYQKVAYFCEGHSTVAACKKCCDGVYGNFCSASDTTSDRGRCKTECETAGAEGLPVLP